MGTDKTYELALFTTSEGSQDETEGKESAVNVREVAVTRARPFSMRVQFSMVVEVTAVDSWSSLGRFTEGDTVGDTEYVG